MSNPADSATAPEAPVLRLDDAGRAIARKRIEQWVAKGSPAFEDFEPRESRRREPNVLRR